MYNIEQKLKYCELLVLVSWVSRTCTCLFLLASACWSCCFSADKQPIQRIKWILCWVSPWLTALRIGCLILVKCLIVIFRRDFAILILDFFLHHFIWSRAACFTTGFPPAKNLKWHLVPTLAFYSLFLNEQHFDQMSASFCVRGQFECFFFVAFYTLISHNIRDTCTL